MAEDVFAPKRIAGLSTRVVGHDRQTIAALWSRVFQQGLPQRLQGGVYSVCYDYESDDAGEYTVLVGCEIPVEAKLPKGLVEQWIPPGAYQLLDASGELPQSISEGWQEIWQTPLQRAYRTDFEEYLPDNVQTIYVGVVPGQEDVPAVESQDD